MTASYHKYKQGVYTPTNKAKCLSQYLAYRSSLELKVMRQFDSSTNILEWASEEIAIPYQNPLKIKKDGQPKICNYYPDFYIKVRTKDGGQLKCLIEIKPDSQTRPPVDKKRRSKNKLLYEQLRYAQNVSKWTAAQSWCQTNGFKFLIMTEKDIEKL